MSVPPDNEFGGELPANEVTDEDTKPGVEPPLIDTADKALGSEAAVVTDLDRSDDLEEDSEHTTIDKEIGRALADEPPPMESADGEPHSASAAARIEDLGPAFPEDPDDWQTPPPESAGTETSGPAGGADEQQLTSEQPALDASGQAEPRDIDAGSDEDAWADFEESGLGWSLTGESQVSPSVPEKPEREYSRENTDVYKLGQPQSAAQQGGRLVCIAGQDTGREYAVDKREMTIGRAPGCSVILTDASVSREHARLLRDADTYVLVDHRSANGTFINGERIDRGRLRSGDEVGFGSTRFRFLEIGDVFKPIDASGAPVIPGARLDALQRLRANPNFRAIVISGAMLVVAFVVTATILGVRYSGTDSRKSSDRIFEYYLQGIDAFKQRRWADARMQFNIVVGLDPSHARGAMYLQEVAKEMQFEQQLAAARASREAGKLALAYAEASNIIDSVYTQDAKELIRGIDVQLDTSVAEARAKLEAGDARGAVELLDGVQAVRPGRPDVLALRDKAVQAVEAPGIAPPERLGSSPPTSRPSSKPALARRSRPLPDRSGRGPVAKATRLFADGDLEAALDLLEGVEETRDVKVLRAKMKKFAKVYDSALEEHRAKRTKNAIAQLKSAKGYESKITGGKGKVAGEINKKLADMYYVQGIGAYLDDRLPVSYRSFKTALDYKGDHGPAQRKLEDLESKAREAFEAGYRAKDTEPDTAREKWRLVLQIVPSNNEYYKKAKHWLDSIR